MLNNDEANEKSTNNLGYKDYKILVKSINWGERDNDEVKSLFWGQF